MSKNELEAAVLIENEASFSVRGNDYLLYGWDQCDGYILSLELNGELVWQSEPRSKRDCINEFLNYYAEL